LRRKQLAVFPYDFQDEWFYAFLLRYEDKSAVFQAGINPGRKNGFLMILKPQGKLA